MLNENAKKWIAALRSGKYAQGRAMLNSMDMKFCCLGVACEVAIQAGVPVKKEPGLYGQKFNYDTSFTVLPLSVQRWLGLASASGHFKQGGDCRSLVALNDGGLYTFNDIADIIESIPEGLFSEPQKENPPDGQADSSHHGAV
jgi:hypothetical protein